MPMNHVVSYQQNQGRVAYSMSRSKPIAIKRVPEQLLEEDVEREACEKRMYENSTWRMYNRIVDHRINTPPSSDHQGGWESPALVPAGSPTVNNNSGLVRPKARYARAEMLSTFMDNSYNEYNDLSSNSNTEPCFAMGLEDEVFDMEL